MSMKQEFIVRENNQKQTVLLKMILTFTEDEAIKMYNYEWDKETGGYTLLPSKITGVTKEVRPVFAEELHFLGFDRDYGWIIPECKEPIMWAEARRYFYKGELVGEASSGGLYDMPTLKNVIPNLKLEPVDIAVMLAKNESIMNGLVQKTLKTTYKKYLEYKTKVSMFYVAYSGGKDSVVMLDIVQRALPHDGFVVVFGDTTMELSATYDALAMAKEYWNTLEWYEARTDFDAEESWQKIGFPARKLRWCCSVHKTAPSIAKLREIYKEKHPNTTKPFKVMVFDGVRAEESDARSTYTMVSDGNKHAVQYNCSPILEWSACELFLYIFKYVLPFNRLYRYGAYRVGCKLCPMASEWYECVLNHIFPEEVAPLLNIVSSSITKTFISEEEKNKYLQSGGWKSRIGGKELILGGNKITEIKTKDTIKFVIAESNYKWDKWMTIVGPVVKIDDDRYSVRYKDINLDFSVQFDKTSTVLTLPALIRSPLSVRFMYLFKNALNKAAYCVNCGECMAECAFGALTITTDDIMIENCQHCEQCLDSSKGCIAARSLGITGGGNNMSVKNISRYQNFGFRQEWLEFYFEMLDEFWTNERMGKYMIIGFRTWLKEAGITESNAITPLGQILQTLGSDSPITWGIIYTNLCYESPIINWYARKLEVGRTYFSDDLPILLGEEYSATVKKNALSSLKETLRLSPIGWLLLQGECELKGKVVSAITKGSWYDADPIVVLYSLYRFAEQLEGLYSFTLTDLLDDSDEREALSPRAIFGIDRDTLKPILQGLANNYSDFIQVDFNKGIMENIDLPAGKNGKKAIDVLSLI